MFTNTKKNQVELLKQKSQNAISIFDRTKNELATINEAITTEKSTRKAEIARLEAELEDLGTQETSNTKVINKIDEFLND